MRRLLAALCAACLLTAPALAAQELTDWIREYLMTDVASVTFYQPTSAFSAYGELVYNDLTQRMELAVSGEDVAALRSVVLYDGPTTIPAAGDGEDGGGETVLSVPEGYVLVTVSCEGREDAVVCLSDAYAVSRQDKLAAVAAEEAARLAEEQSASEEAAEPTPAPAVTPEPTPLPEAAPAPQKSSVVSAFLDSLETRDYIFLFIILILLLLAIVELAFLIVYRRRAENVARNYLRARSLLDKGKRELNGARAGRVQLEKELVAERDRVAALREENERLLGERQKDAGNLYNIPDFGSWKP